VAAPTTTPNEAAKSRLSASMSPKRRGSTGAAARVAHDHPEAGGERERAGDDRPARPAAA
jgi:hypothetical protein